ncbi:MAG: transporter [Bacteroidota bacterium]
MWVVAAGLGPQQRAWAEEIPVAAAEEDAEPVIVELPPEPAEAEPRATAATEVAAPEAVAPEPAAPEPAAPEPATAEAEVPQAPASVEARVESPPQQQVSNSADLPPQPELPGVLTRKGALVIEPGIEYSHTDVNQFSFGGVAILDTVLVGAIEAKQANRDAITGTLGLRLGITDRLEGELRIPYMYRDDSSTNTFVNSGNNQQSISLTDHGLGDIEGALHYQFNDGTGQWPVFVGNFRAKSTTGTSPYDVARNSLGVEEELATGSGFWGFEPSLTVIAPSDPAVFYGNIGYLWNMKSDINKQIGNRYVQQVDPGDAIRFGVGMGLALNEKVSFSIGYQHDWIMKSRTSFSDGDVDSPSLSVGSMTFGVNWQMADNAALNVSVAVGVTNDAPDVRLMARVPITLDLF